MPDENVPRMGIPRGEHPQRIEKKQPRRMFDPDVNAEVPVIQLPDDELVPQKMTAFSIAALDWGVQKLNCSEAHKITKGSGVKVCVADTGASRHPDYGPVLDENIRSFVQGESADDGQGHSAHCMGRVLARGAEFGVAPEATPMFAKVLSNSGSGAVTWIAAGIRWAVENKADVISLSLGGPSQDSYIPPALAYAESQGVIVVAAAGNDGPGANTVDYPGGYKECVCVGAVDSGLLVASFSSRGSPVFVSAPGVNIRSQYIGNRYATMSGTSMATPHVAGLAALWIAANPNVPKGQRPEAFRSALRAVCQDLGGAGRDPNYGYGFPDAAKLVAGATPVPPVPPVPIPPPTPKGWSGVMVYENGDLVQVTNKAPLATVASGQFTISPDAAGGQRSWRNKAVLVELMTEANREFDGAFNVEFRLDGPVGDDGLPAAVYRWGQVGRRRYSQPDKVLCYESQSFDRNDAVFAGSMGFDKAARWLLAGSVE